MRIKWVLAIVCAVYGVMAISCVTPASEDELETMCDNLVQLRGEIKNPSLETIVGDLSVRFDNEARKLQDDQMQEHAALNEEMQARLEEAKNEEEKAQIQEEYANKREEVSERYKPDMATVTTKKSQAMADAKKEVEANQAAWGDAVTECVDQAKKEGVGKKLAQCRIQAQTTDKYWNGCR